MPTINNHRLAILALADRLASIYMKPDGSAADPASVMAQTEGLLLKIAAKAPKVILDVLAQDPMRAKVVASRILELLRTAGSTIPAIKELRAITSLPLLDAKNAVEYVKAHGELPGDIAIMINEGRRQL